MMNQYICRVCKGNECTVLTSQGPPNCGCLHNSDIGALWEQDSSYKSERDTVLDEKLASQYKTILMQRMDGMEEIRSKYSIAQKSCKSCSAYDLCEELRQAGEP